MTRKADLLGIRAGCRPFS